jgi:hypothetical protein
MMDTRVKPAYDELMGGYYEPIGKFGVGLRVAAIRRFPQ